MDNLAKYKLSQYKTIRPLNEEETVILGYDITDDRVCVIKYVQIEKKSIYDRLKNIECDSLPEIYDVFEADGRCVIAEKYIKGKSVEQLINENGAFTEKRAIRYMLDICRALKSVHSLKIIHRDISPDNIIIDENDNAVLLDFDIARESRKDKTTDTEILGTAGFAAPEQYGFAQTDARSDIYSMGVILNYMLTGHIVREGVYEKRFFKKIINNAVKIDPDMRYGSIEDMERALKKYCGHTEAKGIFSQLISDIKQTSMSDLALFPLPGFRTGSVIRMAAALLAYLILVVMLFANSFNSARELIDFVVIYIAEIIFPMWLFGNRARQVRIIPGFRRLAYPARFLASAVIYIAVIIIVYSTVPI